MRTDIAPCIKYMLYDYNNPYYLMKKYYNLSHHPLMFANKKPFFKERVVNSFKG
ncbi:hypothetical protein BDA99DRAFT_513784 [Phascolomyces articulosus]|uniref:Uncharacterized protein n=1 Tax=Phascolomyces articulosus TaxID=60185 RepID=A0AAD5PD82_9FUNG|nr:hypothetical protein BDA99DRAFT_513784 [Phascolomyces articulosus]